MSRFQQGQAEISEVQRQGVHERQRWFQQTDNIQRRVGPYRNRHRLGPPGVGDEVQHQTDDQPRGKQADANGQQGGRRVETQPCQLRGAHQHQPRQRLDQGFEHLLQVHAVTGDPGTGQRFFEDILQGFVEQACHQIRSQNHRHLHQRGHNQQVFVRPR